jgi:hypothetical protein
MHEYNSGYQQENYLVPGAITGAAGFTGANIIKQLAKKRYLGHKHLLKSSLGSAAFGALAGGLTGTFFNKKNNEEDMIYKRASYIDNFAKKNPKTLILAGLLGSGLVGAGLNQLGKNAIRRVSNRYNIKNKYMDNLANDVGQGLQYGMSSSALNHMGNTVRAAGHPIKGRLVSMLGTAADAKAKYHMVHGAYSGYRGVHDAITRYDEPEVVKQSGVLTTMTSTLKPYIDTAVNGAKLTYNTNKTLANAAVTANKVYTDAKRIAAPIGRAMQTPIGKAVSRGIRGVSAGFTAGRKTYKDY